MNRASASPSENLVVLRDAASGRWLRFRHPVEILSAARAEDVLPRLREIENAVAGRHLHAAGWISYEAAPAFDPALAVRPPGPLPLLWFGLYENPEPVDLPPDASALPNDWRADVAPDAYGRAFDQIKRHIRAGDTYQVNFSYRLRRDAFEQDPWQAFLALVDAQRPAYGAYVSAGPWRLCSVSPELFFRLDGARLESRPMKGTAPRGRSAAEDRAQLAALRACAKNRAENLMIVDMVRNDLGRVARPGTVQTVRLCEPEKFPTVWQLVSAVAAETDASVSEIFSAAFPPASITGAPKARTMQIIADLETSPRQVYTGAIGFLSPGRRAQFNVAIRTLLLNVRSRRAEYGVGGGIVWDSDRAAEQAECRTKARILSRPPRPPFSLLETMLWTPADGIRLCELHLARLRDSAEYFDYACASARKSKPSSAPYPTRRSGSACCSPKTAHRPSRLRPSPLSPPVPSSASRSPAAPSTAPTSSSATRPPTAAPTKRPRPIFPATTTSFSTTITTRPPNPPSPISPSKSTGCSARRPWTAASSPASPAPNFSPAAHCRNGSSPSPACWKAPASSSSTPSAASSPPSSIRPAEVFHGVEKFHSVSSRDSPHRGRINFPRRAAGGPARARSADRSRRSGKRSPAPDPDRSAR